MGGSLRPGLAVAVVLFVACCLLPAWAEVFHFDKMPIPEPYSMTTHHVFYVHSEGDAPGRQESASVVFRNLGANLAGNSQLGGYNSVQVSLLPFDNMWDIVDKKTFCAVRGIGKNSELLLQQTPATSHAAIHAVPFPATGNPQNVEFQIKKTGRYILAYSNCGSANTTSATVTGSVLVKNPYGFLPGNEYSNLNFHGWCAVIYVVLNVLWTGMYVRFFRSTFYIQTGIAGISALCLLESSFSWLMYKDWNSTGDLSYFLLLLSSACYVFKYVCAWALLRSSSVAVGLDQEDLDTATPVKLFVSCALFMIQQCAWKQVMTYRHTLQLQSGFVIAVALPGFFIWAALFLWHFLALKHLLNRLMKVERKAMALACFQKVQCVLIAAAVGSFSVSTLQAVDIASQEVMPWNSQFLSSGAANLVFMMVLMAMMLVWLPSEDSWKLVYMQQATEDAEGEGAGIVGKAEVADGLPGELEGAESSFVEPMPRAQAREVKMKPNTVTPEPISAREEEEQPKGEVENAMLL